MKIDIDTILKGEDFLSPKFKEFRYVHEDCFRFLDERIKKLEEQIRNLDHQIYSLKLK